MGLNLSPATLRSLDELSIEPNIVVQFEGFDTKYSAVPVKDFLLYGCPDVYYGDPDAFYGGLKDVEDNLTLIDSKSTTYTIRQQMNYDEGNASSISSMTVGLVDKDQVITQLISPGFDVEDILGRKATISVTFGDVSFFEDSVLVFRGFVTKIDAMSGIVKFKLNHPDNKKQIDLFKSVETQLVGNINASQTTLSVVDASTFELPQGPMTSYVRIGEELIQYTGITVNTFTGLVRGSLGSTATAHNDTDQVQALYCLEGNPIDLALQVMLSGFGTDPSNSDIEVTSFVKVGAGTTQVDNAIYFDLIDIPKQYNILPGDTVTTTGATNGANNITSRTVLSVTKTDSGYYIVVDGAALVLEDTTAALMDVYSQYNTLPDGMRMTPDEVDIQEHIRIRDLFHSATEFRVYIKEDDLDGKEFIEKQLYQPIACYALPRKSRASMGFTVGPIPGVDIETFDLTNVMNPKNVMITRTTNRSFYNEVVYKYDDSPLESSEKFLSGNIRISQTSKNRIPGTTKTLVINSIGLRTDLNAQNIVDSNSNRIIDRYEFGAEVITCKVLMRNSVGVEVGDIVVGDFQGLQVSDITKGNRDFKARLFEVHNKSINFKNGSVEFSLLDTKTTGRFGLMSPCSPIVGVVSSSVFVIGPDPIYPSKYGSDEFRKWESIVSISNPMSVLIRNADYTIQEDLVVVSIDENTFTLQDAAAITLTVGMMVEFTGYVDDDTSDRQKLVYGYMTDDANFPDGENPYSMI